MGGSKNQVSTVQNSVPDWLNTAYQSLVGQGQSTMASHPYQPYTGGFTGDQQTAFQNISQLAGSANNNFQQANSATAGAMNPTYNTVGQYMNPYVGNVVNATMANMNELNGQQQQGVIGNAIAKGAMGGNRVGVAQSELARQQNLANQQTISGLWNDAYGNALGAAQNQQQVGLSAANNYANTGQTQMNTNLAQAGAQLGAGTQQQQFNYQQYLNQQGYPYQQLSWLSGLINGTGPNAGSTSTSTQPGGNIFGQLFGAGLGVASLFNKGGSVKNQGVVPLYSEQSPFMQGDNTWPGYVSSSTPYSDDGGIFLPYIPEIDTPSQHTHFPTPADPSNDNSSDYGGTTKKQRDKGWQNISDYLHRANGGLVPRRMANGGNPYADQILLPSDQAGVDAFYNGIAGPYGYTDQPGYAAPQAKSQYNGNSLLMGGGSNSDPSSGLHNVESGLGYLWNGGDNVGNAMKVLGTGLLGATGTGTGGAAMRGIETLKNAPASGSAPTKRSVPTIDIQAHPALGSRDRQPDDGFGGGVSMFDATPNPNGVVGQPYSGGWGSSAGLVQHGGGTTYYPTDQSGYGYNMSTGAYEPKVPGSAYSNPTLSPKQQAALAGANKNTGLAEINKATNPFNGSHGSVSGIFRPAAQTDTEFVQNGSDGVVPQQRGRPAASTAANQNTGHVGIFGRMLGLQGDSAGQRIVNGLGGLFHGTTAAGSENSTAGGGTHYNGQTNVTAGQLAGANQGHGDQANAVMPDSMNNKRWLTGYKSGGAANPNKAMMDPRPMAAQDTNFTMGNHGGGGGNVTSGLFASQPFASYNPGPSLFQQHVQDAGYSSDNIDNRMDEPHWRTQMRELTGFASGGSPKKKDSTADLYAGLIKPEGGIVGDALIPPPPLAAPSNDNSMAYAPAATPDDSGMNQPPAGSTPFDGMSFDPTQYGNTGNGEVPYTAGNGFQTAEPGYSQNIGDAFKSLGAGKGLNLSPDFRQAMLSAGAGMMSSRSPFFLGAVGEGINKGTDQWNTRQGIERENAKTRADIAQSGQDIANRAFQTAANIPLTQASTGATRYTFTRTAGGVMITDALDPKNTQMVPWGGLLPDGKIANPVTTDAPPLFTTKAPPQGNQIDRRLMVPESTPQVMNEADMAIKDARVQQQSSLSQQQQLTDMEHNLAALPDDGWLSQGAGFQSRLDWAKAVNTSMQVLGMQPIVDPAAVAAGEDISKTTTRLGFELSKTLGSDNAASIVESSVGAVPGGANSKQGAQRIINALEAVNNRRIDYYNFITDWASTHSGSVLGADAYFNKANPPELYALSAYVPKEAMDYLLQHSDKGTAAAFDAKYGNGKSVAQYILNR